MPVPAALAAAIIDAGRRMDARFWVPATAGNLSLRIDARTIAITRSGVHKGHLQQDDIIAVDLEGRPESPTDRPSAETLLHCQLYARDPAIGAVLHGHSVAGTVLSMQEREKALRIQGYEVQKAFAGQTSHEPALHLPLVENDQDIARLARTVAPLLVDARLGYLIRGHGTYVWGVDMAQALARFEGLEFLVACELERRRLP